MTDLNIYILIYSLLLLFIAFGLVLYSAGKSRRIPSWLKWWQPMTRRVWSMVVDNSLPKEDRILIDGVGIAIFGSYLTVFSLLFFVFIEYQTITPNLGALIYVIAFFVGLRFQEWITYKIVKKTFQA